MAVLTSIRSIRLQTSSDDHEEQVLLRRGSRKKSVTVAAQTNGERVGRRGRYQGGVTFLFFAISVSLSLSLSYLALSRLSSPTLPFSLGVRPCPYVCLQVQWFLANDSTTPP